MYDAFEELITFLKGLDQTRGIVIRNHHYGPAYLIPKIIGDPRAEAAPHTYEPWNVTFDEAYVRSYLRQEFDMVAADLKRYGKATEFYVIDSQYAWVRHYRLSLQPVWDADAKGTRHTYQLARV